MNIAGDLGQIFHTSVFLDCTGRHQQARLRYVPELHVTRSIVLARARYRIGFEEYILVAAEILTVADHGACCSFWPEYGAQTREEEETVLVPGFRIDSEQG